MQSLAKSNKPRKVVDPFVPNLCEAEGSYLKYQAEQDHPNHPVLLDSYLAPVPTHQLMHDDCFVE